MTKTDGPDPGPMARYEALVRDPQMMGTIVQRIAEGETLKQLAVAWRIPPGRLAQWFIEDRNRNELYINACAIRETFRTDEIHEIAAGAKDKLGVAVAALRIKAIQWAAAKWNPARFGDSSNVNVSVKDDAGLDRDALVLEAARTVAFLLAQGAEIAGRQVPQGLLSAPAETGAQDGDATHGDAGPI